MKSSKSKAKEPKNEQTFPYMYYEWIKDNEEEKLMVNPNGTFEIVSSNNENWYLDKKLRAIICIDALAVWNVDINYFNHLK